MVRAYRNQIAHYAFKSQPVIFKCFLAILVVNLLIMNDFYVMFFLIIIIAVVNLVARKSFLYKIIKI